MDTTKQLPTAPDLDKRFKKLFQSGKLVQVHVSKWSMTASATEADLGFRPEKLDGGPTKKIPAFITLGKKALFTDDVRLVFGRIESAARAYLSNNSHKFPIADAHFVPQHNLQKAWTGLEEFKTKFMREVQTFVTNYETYKAKMFATYPEHKDSLLPYYPPVEVVRQKFDFSISVYEVSAPKKVEKITMQELITQNIAVESAKVKYDTMMKEQYQHHLQQMQEFIKESALAMRGEIIRTFEVIAAKITNQEVISEANLKTIRSTIDSFDALDFLDDVKVKENLKAVKALISKGANFKTDAEAVSRLSVAVNTTLETAKTMSDIDSITGEYNRRLDSEL
jgi:hypothetical protein